MKRWVRLLAALCAAVFLGTGALADEQWRFAVDGDRMIVDEGVQVIGYVGELMEDDQSQLVQAQLDMLDLNVVRELVLPDSLQMIGGSAGYRLGTEELTIPEGVWYMGGYCFEYSSLKRIYLPSTLREVSAFSFGDCDELEEIIVAADNPWLMSEDGVLYSKDGGTLICYPAGKQALHYDVKPGVHTIEQYAFFENDHLRTISLPLGLHTIQRGAFSSCGRLEAAHLPLTLKNVGMYAFSDCVSLERINLPEDIEVIATQDERDSWQQWQGTDIRNSILRNTPLLAGKGAVQSGGNADGEPELVMRSRYGILNPENARDLVTIYEQPSTQSRKQGSFACGSTVQLQDYEDGWYRVYWRQDQDEGSGEGYVQAELVEVAQTGESLFAYAGVRVKDGGVQFKNNGPCVLPYDEPLRAIPKGTTLHYERTEGQWAVVAFYDEESYAAWGYLYPSELIYTREYTGDSDRYGVVVSDDARDRLNMRATPSKNGEKLGKYFSGTQVKILGEEGDWYHVWVDFQEGYMMKEFVQEVLQEAR
ncbi:MAG: hypothetical protein E7319_05375 [Clostridiales bacterium]|nr:hypothetical protein [Clostridiales bacterium]